MVLQLLLQRKGKQMPGTSQNATKSTTHPYRNVVMNVPMDDDDPPTHVSDVDVNL